MVSEPNKKSCGSSIYHTDAERDAAVRIVQEEIWDKSCPFSIRDVDVEVKTTTRSNSSFSFIHSPFELQVQCFNDSAQTLTVRT